MYAEIAASRAVALALTSAFAVVFLALGCSMSLRPAYWSSLAMLMLPEEKRRTPSGPKAGRGWRVVGSVAVWMGLICAGVAVWLAMV
jgi:hypothetical protein